MKVVLKALGAMMVGIGALIFLQRTFLRFTPEWIGATESQLLVAWGPYYLLALVLIIVGGIIYNFDKRKHNRY